MRKLILPLVLIILLSACKETDVVANYSITSFNEILQTVPNNIVNEDGNFQLISPDGKEKFIWGKNIALEADLAPFLEAGLDISKLPEEIRVNEDKLLISIDNNAQAENDDPTASFEAVIRNNRDSLGYHMELNHFGFNLPGENSFEWAKDIKANDKDMVFVLNPMPFKEAGVDVSKIPGWTLAEIKMMDMSGKATHMEKLLKAFDL